MTIVSRVLAISAILMSLSGCIVGGMMADQSEVKIDETSMDSDFRASLMNAKRLAFLSTDASTVYAAEFMEVNSDLEVSLLSPPEGASPSQGKRYMTTVCEGSEDPDYVFYFRTITSDAGTGTTMKGVITGRAMFEMSMLTEVLGCQSGERSRFNTIGKINSGVYNADSTRMAQILGDKFGNEMLGLVGKPML